MLSEIDGSSLRNSSHLNNVLAIDDAKDILLMLDFELTEEGYNVFTAENVADGLDVLLKENIDLILLDIVMPNVSGLELLFKIKNDREFKKIPVIMLSASDQSEDIVSSLDLGADDFVSKPYISKVLLARMRTSLRLLASTKTLEKMALTDFLTGINNRRQFYNLSNIALNKNKRDKSCLSIALFDIDYFKNINDTYGHDVGDNVLVEFSNTLSEHFRRYDIVGRVGGEEFCVCLPDTKLEDAVTICDRLREILSKKIIMIVQGKQTFNLTINVSVGVSNSIYTSNLEMLIKQADSGLYFAKSNGRNQIHKYHPDEA